jgi:hypothetical protein
MQADKAMNKDKATRRRSRESGRDRINAENDGREQGKNEQHDMRQMNAGNVAGGSRRQFNTENDGGGSRSIGQEQTMGYASDECGYGVTAVESKRGNNAENDGGE